MVIGVAFIIVCLALPLVYILGRRAGYKKGEEDVYEIWRHYA